MADEPYVTEADDVVVVQPGESDPPVRVIMPDGTVLTLEQLLQQETENQDLGDVPDEEN